MTPKTPLAYLLSLLLLTACSPSILPNAGPTGGQTVSNQQLAEFADQVRVADLKLFAQDAMGNTNPLSPEQVQAITFGTTTLSNQDVHLLNGASNDELATSTAAQVAWLNPVVQGQARVMYLGAGTYRYFVAKPQTAQTLSVQIKGQNTAHQLYVPAELQTARLVLAPEGQVEGVLETTADFKLNQAGLPGNAWWFGGSTPVPPVMRNVFSFQLLQLPNFIRSSESIFEAVFNLNAFVFKPFESRLQEIEDRAQQIEQEAQQLQALEADAKAKLLLDIAGSWKPESPLVTSLAGGDVTLTLAFEALNTFQAGVQIGETDYSASGELPTWEIVNNDTLNVTFRDSGRTLTTEIEVLSPNRLSVTLKAVEGAPELQGILNQAFTFHRAL